jgi:transcriptional regulator with XRE-family HTH domain
MNDVANRLGWDASTLGKMESGRSLGSPEIVEALDEYYGVPGKLLALWELAVGDPTQFKEQYRRYMVLETEAHSLWHFGVSTVHGLLQTDGYARELLALGGHKGDELDQQ